MSTLWTPSGEHRVDRSTPADAATNPADAAVGASDDSGNLDDQIAALLPEGMKLEDLSAEERAKAEEMIQEMANARKRLLNTPAVTIVVNHAMGLYELAALHLSAQPPNFAEATIAIDALSAIVEALKGRLGEAERDVAYALDEIRKAFVQIKSQAAASSG